MLNFTDKAKERILQYLDLQQSQGVTALRVAGTQADPKLFLAKEGDRQADDLSQEVAHEARSFTLLVDPLSAKALKGATVDFVENVISSGFRIFFPSPTWDDPLAQKVQDVLDKQINPGVASHGGKVTLQGVKDNVAYIRLGGGCQGCGMADVTLKQGIEVMIKEAVPEIKDVIDITDHALGENPYYQAAPSGGHSPLEDRA
ncbi:MAG: NifU family protein [Truepera sp.]|nr:NifU family protein [Truepera sp.]